MKRRLALFLLAAASAFAVAAQARKVYDESVDPMAQIDEAVAQAAQEGKHVACQLGGNWCRWCLMFADFIDKDEEISNLISDNYVYIHVNYSREDGNNALSRRLGNVGRFGFPAIVVLDQNGNVLHVQDTGLLEEGQGYDRGKVLRFFQLWTPAAVRGDEK